MRFNIVAWSLSQSAPVQWLVDRYLAMHDTIDTLIHHREIIREYDEMAHRFSCVLCDVTQGMSKTNYDLDAMRAEISDKRQTDDDYAVETFIEELDFEPKAFSITALCEAAGLDAKAMLAKRAKHKAGNYYP